MAPAKYMLKEVEIALSSESVTKQALIREIIQAQNTFPYPRTGLPTIHSSLTVFSTELAVLIKEQDRDLINAITAWFDCEDPWRYSTISRKEERIEKVWVNLIGATTPSLIPSIFPQEVIGGGLSSRVIFVYAGEKSKVVVFPKLTPEEKALRTLLINDLKEIQNIIGEYTPTEGYLDLYSKWYTHTEAYPPFTHDELFQYYVGRRPTHLRKISMIMAASHSSDLILREEDLSRAIDWFEECEVSMPYVYAGHGRADYATMLPRISIFIMKERKVKFGQLVRKFMRDISKRDLEELVAALTAQEPPFCFITREISTDGLGRQVVVPWITYNDKQDKKGFDQPNPEWGAI
jgi:hypothetical protein